MLLSNCDTFSTVDYAHNDFAIAALAQALGQQADYDFFQNRSERYLNVWSEADQWFCPRHANGTFFCSFSKVQVVPFSPYFIEGDAWHYRFYGTNPLKTFKSVEYFVEQLSLLMVKARIDNDTFLPNPYYWAGNEPGMGSAWLFAWANRSDLTAVYTQWVSNNVYSASASGLPGNNDYGALASWLVWTYMGAYPMYSGNPQLSLSVPMLPSFVIRRDDGSTLTITRQGPVNGTLVKVLVNGQPHSSALLPVSALFSSSNASIQFVTA